MACIYPLVSPRYWYQATAMGKIGDSVARLQFRNMLLLVQLTALKLKLDMAGLSTAAKVARCITKPGM